MDIIWKYLMSFLFIVYGIMIIKKKQKEGISFSDQFRKEKWLIIVQILIFVIIVLLIVF